MCLTAVERHEAGSKVGMAQCDPTGGDEQAWSYDQDKRQLRAYGGLCLGSSVVFM